MDRLMSLSGFFAAVAFAFTFVATIVLTRCGERWALYWVIGQPG
jgi:hypothetical protein